MSTDGATTSILPLIWCGDVLDILDQRALPDEERWLVCRTVDDVANAICCLAVRGAPLIGVAAAYGMALAAGTGSRESGVRDLLAAADLLAATRPTAVNLFWALARCRAVIQAASGSDGLGDALLAEAEAIHAEDRASCRAIAQAGATLLPEGARILTHCNTGALATGGVGTALGVIRAAHAAGRVQQVWVDETRPLLQGARLTAWELAHDGIPHRLICDSMAASLMRAGQVDAVIVGADRIARNGDTANKVGTYGLAVLARAHEIPFYVAAPWSTVDLMLADGAAIPIEERAEDEVLTLARQRIAPEATHAYNPAFDVTPGELITAIITERGVLRKDYTAHITQDEVVK
jgi:methylthioribose-1-phosphate isomerase